jgi:hypothetical protein
VIFLFRRLKQLLTKNFLVVVYFALFHSHLLYGLELWGHAPATQSVLLLQKKVVRVIDAAGFRDHCKPIFVKLGILTVINQYILLNLVYVKKQSPLLAKRGDQHHHNTRGKQNINIPFCRLSKKKDCFPVLSMKLFNALPVSIRDLELRSFEARMKRWLLENPFYNITEYFDALSHLPPRR